MAAIAASASAFLFQSAQAAAPSAAQPSDPAQLEFFEKSVRPLLEEHCLECHSALKGKTKGGLALDSAKGLLKGGASGPGLVPGSPEKSLLFKAVSYADPDLKMPPEDKRLSREQVDILQRWIQSGAYDPREGRPPGADPEAAKKHWAFQPVRKPQPPGVRDAAWARTPADLFVLSALEAKNLRPSPDADKGTLLRRLSFDLHGLPPSFEQLQDFVSDQRPDAYERAVEDLLASPRFGERWGRYWLDVARYSDTKGLPAPINADRRFHFAWSYRDYVIGAFNADKPFNEFLREQLAADLLPEPRPKAALAALGFLTVGRCFQNSINDIIDDRIDVVTRGLLGLTVSCARCHDHKSDPIPTGDYYSLHGIFLSSEEPAERPVIAEPSDSPEHSRYLEKRAALVQKIDSAVDEEVRKANQELLRKIPEYLVAALEVPQNAESKAMETLAGERKLVGLPLSRWSHTLSASREEPLFGPWNALSALPADGFEARSAALCAQWKTDPPRDWPAALVDAFSRKPPKDLLEAARIYGDLCAQTAAAMEKNPGGQDAPLEDPLQEALRTKLFTGPAPARLSRAEVEKTHSRKVFEARSKVKDEINLLDATDPAAPIRAMALYDKPQAVQPVVYLRGNPANRGPAVPRQFLEVLSGGRRIPFTKGSGRLELAEAITDASNPLTPRVAVNRIWLHLFGRGLVETPNDFGVRTAPPPIPGLLDHLAATFLEKHWSTKAIVRELVLSRTYRQSSAARADAATADPGNDLLHAMRRKRLDFEAMRDTLLHAAGRLEETLGGRAVDLTKAPFSGRRSVYGYIDRQDLPSMFRVFDFANPDISTGQRFETSVPQQALFLMNHAFLRELAESLAKHPSVQAAPSGAEKIRALFQRVLLRAPSPVELEASNQLAARFPSDSPKAWSALSQVLLLTNELVFVD